MGARSQRVSKQGSSRHLNQNHLNQESLPKMQISRTVESVSAVGLVCLHLYTRSSICTHALALVHMLLVILKSEDHCSRATLST